jgi:hypothetical protein
MRKAFEISRFPPAADTLNQPMQLGAECGAHRNFYRFKRSRNLIA